MHFGEIIMSPKIYDLAKIVNKQNFTIADYSQIDDFVFINAGEETKIGRFVHIASFCSVVGGGTFYMEDFSALSAGSRVITGSDDFLGGALAGPGIPPHYTNVTRKSIHICKHALVGTNAIIFPGVTIGEGAVVGAGTIVRKDLEPWTVYVGQDCKPLKARKREIVLEMEAKLFKELELC